MKPFKNKSILRFSTFALIGLLYGSTIMGQDIKKEITLPAFDKLKVENNLSLTISQGEIPMLIVEGEEDFINEFKPSVSKNTLSIDASDMEGLTKMHIVVKDLNTLVLEGATDVTGEGTIKANSFKIVAEDAASVKLDFDVVDLQTIVEGAATLKYSGKAQNHDVQIRGAASVKAYNLQSEKTNINLSGAGTAQVDVTQLLSGDISGLGSIIYKNKPDSISVTSSGLGSVRKAGGSTEVSTEETDTTRFNLGQKQVQILSKNDDDKKKKKKFNGHWGGIELGMNNYLNKYMKMKVPAEYDFLELKTSKSLGVALNIYEQNIKLYKDRFGIVTGLGLTFNNYKFIGNDILVSKSPVVAAVSDSTKDFIKNKLTVTYLTVPLILEVNTGSHSDNKFHFGAGVIMGARLGAHSKQVYEVNGSKYKDKSFDDFNLHPFKLDATVRVGWGIVNLFANYSLTPLFKDGTQPEMYPFTVGLRVLGW